jgi:hypothetical protein
MMFSKNEKRGLDFLDSEKEPVEEICRRTDGEANGEVSWLRKNAENDILGVFNPTYPR